MTNIAVQTESPGAAGVGRTHARVRERPGSGGARYAAVYAGLAAGHYTIWHDPDTTADNITVTAGQVTDVTLSWPSAATAAPRS